ncbi:MULTISPECIES: CopG family ribbon-helix-helix protein [Leptolyngbya]|jgi:predicted transcriptional regulator|uniref:CopG family protein n=2 Tax=Leptolyngbya boryana TaxID=1184 RepID=A0A1Z4JFV8_LEPBY|nr:MULTISPECIES: ribbon-helix-helix protein, CopG family [Leptolyngbya]BAY55600.1 CopG family protein [Leptolyngbya boryana NIES-2135]MBD1854597.1 ribbon-helix-helix protein, CopG family [Leptolyngbya sp. FACHB-1624]MBD2369960.1 ribbon-helix-helix protein, CopG family [Leptolyngbya sp. FACHB-161]MBD2376338.1 ribbon-helix-helix protein, CopG family [Leptolyngbya sp. FACHB-238]MBD2400613.1 ribbon-helix-helix protein, CopG family [Leptolyngbya sp. FACHB-239]
MSQSETVTVQLPIEIKQKLEALATSTNRSQSWLVTQAITTYVETQSQQIQQIEAAVDLAESDRAVWVEGEAVEAWLNSWGTDNEKPTPCA